MPVTDHTSEALVPGRSREASAPDASGRSEDRDRNDATTEACAYPLGQVLDSLYAFVAVLAPDGTLLHVNRAALQAAALRAEDVLGRPFEAAYWWSYSRSVQQRLRAAIERARDGTPSRYEEVVRLAEERLITIDFQIVPMCDEAGGVTHLVPSAMDITDRTQAEKRLRENEARLRAIVDTAVDGIITINDQGTILFFNAAAERMFGHRAGDVLGRELGLLMPSPHREQHGSHLARYRATGVSRVIGTVLETEALRKDGTVFPIELSVSKVTGLDLFTGIIRDISERRKLRRQLITIAEEQRRQIGQELHDNIGQELTGISLMSDALAEALMQQGSAEAELAARIHNCLMRVQQRVKAVSRGLIPVDVDARGLMNALAELAGSTSLDHRIECTFECRAPVAVQDARAATQLYRIAQQAIANSIEHGRAGQIRISLAEQDGILRLEVRDNGVGLQDEPPSGQGVGFKVMQYRAESIGGALEIAAEEDGGMKVVCTLHGDRDHVQPHGETR